MPVKKDVEIQKAEMDVDMQRVATTAVDWALKNCKTGIAKSIKIKMENKYGGSWCCIIGNKSSLSWIIKYEPNHYINFEVGEEKILLFKSAD